MQSLIPWLIYPASICPALGGDHRASIRDGQLALIERPNGPNFLSRLGDVVDGATTFDPRLFSTWTWSISHGLMRARNQPLSQHQQAQQALGRRELVLELCDEDDGAPAVSSGNPSNTARTAIDCDDHSDTTSVSSSESGSGEEGQQGGNRNGKKGDPEEEEKKPPKNEGESEQKKPHQRGKNDEKPDEEQGEEDEAREEEPGEEGSGEENESESPSTESENGDTEDPDAASSAAPSEDTTGTSAPGSDTEQEQEEDESADEDEASTGRRSRRSRRAGGFLQKFHVERDGAVQKDHLLAKGLHNAEVEDIEKDLKNEGFVKTVEVKIKDEDEGVEAEQDKDHQPASTQNASAKDKQPFWSAQRITVVVLASALGVVGAGVAIVFFFL
ncbi:unnamed protein product [Amoebophrya sp. A25]|nr:unnamed protein product [Amoebophrya sp. A25]|eukprot:GSA25T00010127001.1